MDYNFQFIGKGTPVRIYDTGLVRFSKDVAVEFGLGNARLKWGFDKKHQVLAFKKDQQGRRVSISFTTSCPLEFVNAIGGGKFTIEKSGDTYILHKILTN